MPFGQTQKWALKCKKPLYENFHDPCNNLSRRTLVQPYIEARTLPPIPRSSLLLVPPPCCEMLVERALLRLRRYVSLSVTTSPYRIEDIKRTVQQTRQLMLPRPDAPHYLLLRRQ